MEIEVGQYLNFRGLPHQVLSITKVDKEFLAFCSLEDYERDFIRVEQRFGRRFLPAPLVEGWELNKAMVETYTDVYLRPLDVMYGPTDFILDYKLKARETEDGQTRATTNTNEAPTGEVEGAGEGNESGESVGQ